MTSFTRNALLVFVVVAPAAGLAQAPAEAQPAPAPSAPPTTARRTISIQFQGSLRDALNQIAREGGLNLVITGDLDQEAQVHLSGITAEEALRTVAEANDLRLAQNGSIWTLRPLTAQELSAGAAGPSSEAQLDAAAERAEAKALAEAERLEQLARRKQAQAPRSEVAREEARELKESARELRRRTRDALRVSGEDARDRVSMGSIVVARDEVVENAVSWGGGLQIDGRVENDAIAFVGDITLGPRAVVEGDVVAFGGSVRRAEGAVVEGDVLSFGGAVLGQAVKEGARELHPDATTKSTARRERHTPAVIAGLIWFMTLFGIGFLATLLMPGRMKRIEQEIQLNPLKSSFTGFLSILALFPLSILLVVTVIGIPVAAALWLLAMLSAVIGYAAVAAELGKRLPLFRGRKTQALVLALGVALLVLVGVVPVLGPLALTFLGFMGFGAIVRTRFGSRSNSSPGSGDLDDLPTGVPL